jgi:hypothetical protein
MIVKSGTNAANFYIMALNNRMLNEVKNPLKLPSADKNVDTFTAVQMYRELENVEQEGKTFDTLLKCIRIAFRIMKGDNVPARDDRFLFENEPAMHMRAWLMRLHKCDPEDHDSVLDDEDVKSLGRNQSFKVISGCAPSVDLGLAVETFDISI